MKLRVLHAATHGHNIGDGALVAGMHRVLGEDLDVELEIHPLDVLGHKLRGERDMLPRRTAATLHEHYDLVLVGGGGMIEGGKGNYLSGINFNFHLDVLRESRIPWVFYALGDNQFRRTFFFHRRRLRRLVRLCEEGGHPFSVRNDGSADRLRRRIGASSVATVPDPGLWVPPGDGVVPEIAADDDRPHVLLQLAGDRTGRRFGWRQRGVLRRLAEQVQELVKRRDAHLLLCPHLLDDVPLFAELLGFLPARVRRESMTMTPVLQGAAAAPAFFDRYRRVDLVLGMRGHSTICAVGVGTPVIGLASHDKVGGFLREVGLGDWVVELDDANRLRHLADLATTLLDDRETARSRVRQLLSPLRDEARAFHQRIAERLDL
jgi:polysaccharide pyruvyl transferase WcaK-like protein